MAAYPSHPGHRPMPDPMPFSGEGTLRGGHIDGFRENGRFYGNYKKFHYPFPYDEDEKERLDIFHKIFTIARKDLYYIAPITFQETDEKKMAKVLDLGCGTGIWAIDVADKNPKVEVRGVDLALIQPEFIPPNVSFQQMDVEDPWQHMGPGTWDMIHMRTLNGSIANWSHLYGEICRHLVPRVGHVEQVEIDFVPQSDDGSVTRNSYVSQWAEELMDATEKLGRPMRVNPALTKQRMMAAGLVDFQHHTIMLPLNGWPSDPHRRELGRWFNLGMKQGIHALTVAPLSRAHNRSGEDVVQIINKVTQEIHSRELRGFCTIHIFIARRP